MTYTLWGLDERGKEALKHIVAARQKRTKSFRKNLKEVRANNSVVSCPYEAKKCCSENWKQVEKETNLIKNHSSVVERNKQINAAYADLNLKDPEGQKWAGTAAIVSKQVGCTMQNNFAAGLFSLSSLGKGNTAIFKNIYPTLKMYELSRNSMTQDEFLKCMDNTIGKVSDGKKNLAPLKKAVKNMYSGKGGEAAINIADHEQGTIIQKAMWSSRITTYMSKANQGTGSYLVDTNVYFVGDCTKPKSRRLEFGKENDLSVAKDRIRFYKKRFVPFYDKLKKKEISTIMKTIRDTGGTH